MIQVVGSMGQQGIRRLRGIDDQSKCFDVGVMKRDLIVHSFEIILQSPD
jgi:hypothetical protein